MKNLLPLVLLLIATAAPITATAQRAKKVPMQSLSKEQISDSIIAIYNYYENFRTDLTNQLTQSEDTTLINALLLQYDVVEQNCNQHIFNFCEAYAPTSPDALEFIFSLRTMVPKEQIIEIYSSLKGKNKKLPYAELLKTYIDSPQAQIGQAAINFTATAFDEAPFDLEKITAQKNVIIIFGGLEKISARELTWVNMVYDGIDQEKTEIIYFDPTAKTAQELAALRTQRNLAWNFISDFKNEWSPATIAYDVQATPTFAYITKGGTLQDWGAGDLQLIINNLAK